MSEVIFFSQVLKHLIVVELHGDPLCTLLENKSAANVENQVFGEELAHWHADVLSSRANIAKIK